MFVNYIPFNSRLNHEMYLSIYYIILTFFFFIIIYENLNSEFINKLKTETNKNVYIYASQYIISCQK